MTESLQIALYPLGFLSSIFFGARFLIQWLESEKAGCSSVSLTFWCLSLLGNIALALHSLVQMQAHVLVIQIINGALSLRNINLMGPNPWPFKKMAMALSLILMITLLVLFFLGGSFFRVPVAPWSRDDGGGSVSLMWHIVGTIGLILFSSRFFIQWILAEIRGRSFLGKTFWWTSLVGDILCLVYFARLGDSVNAIGPIFGLVPYIRNLMLIRRADET
jgi:lipid-A-disaccharide synthase-like uncharacterized protein